MSTQQVAIAARDLIRNAISFRGEEPVFRLNPGGGVYQSGDE